jgi:hypothetical protein
MLTCFLFAGLSAKMRATTSLLIGTILVVAALTIIGLSNLAWICVVGMAVFSIGEMLASPKFSEFIGNIAPSDKKAMWIGFAQIPILVGQTLEGKLGPQLYHMFSEKDVLARAMLINNGMDPAQVTEAVLPVGEAFQKLVEFTGKTPAALTQALYDANHVGLPWLIFACLGVISACLIWAYGRWFRKYAAREKRAQQATQNTDPTPNHPGMSS